MNEFKLLCGSNYRLLEQYAYLSYKLFPALWKIFMTSPSLSNLEKHLCLLRGIEEFSPSERKIARLLLALFPDFPRRAIPRSTFSCTYTPGRIPVYSNVFKSRQTPSSTWRISSAFPFPLFLLTSHMCRT